jgi:DNA-binding GntR family transcriptional regulator
VKVETMKNNSSKSEKVYKIIQDDIIERRFLPGQMLVERELIEKLGVSKTPVREALARLKRDGLVEGTLHRSIVVSRILRKDAVEIFDLREILEGLAARGAAEKITPEKAKEIHSIIQLSEECIKKNNLKEYAPLDLRFHNLIRIISENERLCEMMQRLHYQIRILMRTSITLPGRGGRVSLNEHKKIVKEIVNRNPDLAEKMAKEHIKKTKESILDWFDRVQW